MRLSLLFDQLDGTVQQYGIGIVFFLHGSEEVAESHVRTKTPDGNDHILSFILSQVARQLEQVHRFFEGDGIQSLIVAQLGVARFLGLFSRADLCHRTKTAHTHQHGMTCARFLAQDPFTRNTLGFLLGHLHGLVKRAVELLQHLLPLQLAVGDVVELALHVCGETVVEYFGKVRHQEIVDKHANVGREQLVLLRAGDLGLRLRTDAFVFQGQHAVGAFFALSFFFHHIPALLYRRDGRRVR